MTQAELLALDDYTDARAKMAVAKMMINLRKEKMQVLVRVTVVACRAMQRLAAESGVTLTNDQVWSRIAFPDTPRPASY